MDNYNYPPGADTPDAPWNQQEVVEIAVQCDTCITLRKDITIYSDNYYVESYDDDGTKNIILNDDYKDVEDAVMKQHTPLPEMLNELAVYIQKELDSGVTGKRKWQLQQMLEDCQGWTQDYIEVENYNT